MSVNASNLLAVQLYTLRDHTRTAADLASALQRVSEIGYRAVQLSAVGAMSGESPDVDARVGRMMLDDHNIQCIATHRDWNSLKTRLAEEIEFHQTLGSKYLAIGSLPGEYLQQGLDGYRRWLGEAEPIAAQLSAAGICFGYHNHSFEFEPLGQERRQGFDVLVEAGKNFLDLELDVYWAACAGYDPVRQIEKAKGRLAVVHLKDMEVVGNEAVMSPIGEGNLDWKRIIPALGDAGTKWFCVEQDICRRDTFDCLQASYDFLVKNFNL